MNQNPQRSSHPERDQRAEHGVASMIREHLRRRDESPGADFRVAAVSTSDRFGWAKRAGVPLNVVDAQLEQCCERVPAGDKHWAVPRYRMRSSE